MRISDWSSDVCSSDLQFDHSQVPGRLLRSHRAFVHDFHPRPFRQNHMALLRAGPSHGKQDSPFTRGTLDHICAPRCPMGTSNNRKRSEEHTSELQSLMRISYAVFCLKKKITHIRKHRTHTHTLNR